MKRFLLILLCTILYINVFASSHIKFMGIELNEPIEIFQNHLKARGFSFIDSYESSYKYIGKFANEIVTLTILTSPNSKIVCKVIVHFPIKKTWKELKKDYFTKKNMYKSKYILDSEFEFFLNPYEDGDGYELRAVSNDKCNYVSFFQATDGYITIQIANTKQVKATYEDTKNIQIAQQELNQNALDDI